VRVGGSPAVARPGPAHVTTVGGLDTWSRSRTAHRGLTRAGAWVGVATPVRPERSRGAKLRSGPESGSRGRRKTLGRSPLRPRIRFAVLTSFEDD
jgi:hypothetical protein